MTIVTTYPGSGEHSCTKPINKILQYPELNTHKNRIRVGEDGQGNEGRCPSAPVLNRRDALPWVPRVLEGPLAGV